MSFSFTLKVSFEYQDSISCRKCWLIFCEIELLIVSTVALGNQINIDRVQWNGLMIIKPFLPQTNWGPTLATSWQTLPLGKDPIIDMQFLFIQVQKEFSKKIHFVNKKYV
jgi:hypothetical protein